ncbi:MAG: tRNA epoxyqueuosine(34) reductase QueG [Nitrospinota bacterium]
MSRLNPEETGRLASLLRQESKALGFDSLAIAQASQFARGEFFERWLSRGFGGKMSYLYRNRDCRMDPRRVWPEVKTVVTVAMNYHTGIRPAGETDGPGGRKTSRKGGLLGAVSRYAWGRDYHKVLRKRLLRLARVVEQSGFGRAVKCYVDTGPVIEREWAARGGLGWIGKNTLVLNPSLGSWFFLGVMLLDIELPGDTPQPDLCGTCDRCIRACPTGALIRPYVMDARRCISYLNIELRGWVPRDLRPLMGNWVFGCDECQTVCPYNRPNNRELPVTSIQDFLPREGLDAPDLVELLEMDEETFRKRFEGTALLRARWVGIIRNAAVALGNSQDGKAVEPLGRALEHPEAIIRGHAAWALGKLGGLRAHELLTNRLTREGDARVREEITTALVQFQDGDGRNKRIASLPVSTRAVHKTQ